MTQPTPPPAKGPLYAIDYTEESRGRTFAKTKRRLRWRFGFADADAVAAGNSGAECRGMEHDITMVWSVTSGKVLIMADGEEVWFVDDHGQRSMIEFSWTMENHRHVLKILAHASRTLNNLKDVVYTRQFDFFVDGRSYFEFPKVYQLGLHESKTMSPRMERRVQTAARNEVEENPELRRNSEMEDFYLRQALEASRELAKKREAGEKVPEKSLTLSIGATELLNDFFSDFDSTTVDPFAAATAPVQALVDPDPFSPEPLAATTPSGLTGDSGAPSGERNLADEAFKNLVGSVDAFGITGATIKPPVAVKNPFDSENKKSNATLGEIKKAVMNAPPEQGVMVMADTQGGDWGGIDGAQQ